MLALRETEFDKQVKLPTYNQTSTDASKDQQGSVGCFSILMDEVVATGIPSH